MTEERKQLLESWARIFIAAALAAYIAIGAAPWDIDAEGWKTVVAAGISATVLTIYNFVRPGETRFGHGAENSSRER